MTPILIVVKSQQLYEEMEHIKLDKEGWLKLQSKCAKIVIDRQGQTKNKETLQKVMT